MTPSIPIINEPAPTFADPTDGRSPAAPDEPHAVYVYDVDDTTYEYDHPTITGGQIMTAAGIPSTEGLIRVLEDGTREAIDAHDEVHLVSGIQFKRRPRFKRG